LDLNFSDVSTIFNEFSKLLRITLKQILQGTLERTFRNYKYTPGLHKSLWKDRECCNVVLTGEEELVGGGSLPDLLG
jgi:hypothetical protein